MPTYNFLQRIGGEGNEIRVYKPVHFVNGIINGEFVVHVAGTYDGTDRAVIIKIYPGPKWFMCMLKPDDECDGELGVFCYPIREPTDIHNVESN